MEKEYTLKSGIIAVSIYFCIVGSLFWYFGYKSEEKDVGAQNEQIIAVDISALDERQDLPSVTRFENKTNKIEKSSEATPQVSLQKEKPVEQTQKEESTQQKKPIDDKPIPVEAKSKTQIVKKQETKKIQNTKPTQKIKEQPKTTNDLFANIKSNTPITTTVKNKPSFSPSKTMTTNISKTTSSAASQRINKEFAKQGNVGVEDAYKSKVKSILQGWPAQSSYAGERAKISFVIQPNGDFDFKIIQPSANEEFNQGLVQYLKQLQRVGFGPHAGSRAYLFDVNFIAER
ncbi:MAG: TonB C-terminal domain-containing protein [Sulfurovaceae bacterium]